VNPRLPPARRDLPGDDVHQPAAHQIRLGADFQLVGLAAADVEEVHLFDGGHAALQGGQIGEGFGAHQAVVTAVVEQVLARHRVERADDFDARLGDAVVEPVRPVAEDLDDVGEAGRQAALQRLDHLAIGERPGEREAHRDLAVLGGGGEVFDLRSGSRGQGNRHENREERQNERSHCGFFTTDGDEAVAPWSF
jgi:hypothetical protein